MRSGPGVATLVAKLKELDGLQAKTGFFETARYKDGTPVAYVAAIQEFGAIVGLAAAQLTYQTGALPTRGLIVIPPRPFMRPTAAAQGAKWMAQLAAGAKSILTGGAFTPRQVLEAVALGAAGDVRKFISTVFTPPNTPSTIAGKKGATKPLVDTGLMRQSVTGVVENADGSALPAPQAPAAPVPVAA